MNPKDYGLAEQDFYQTEDKSLGLHRRALQTDLYILGLYIIKKYSSFAIFISEETFRSTNIQRNNERHRDYKGIYKYYFFVKSPRNRDRNSSINTGKKHFSMKTLNVRYVYSLKIEPDSRIALGWQKLIKRDTQKKTHASHNPRKMERIFSRFDTTKRAFRNRAELQAMKAKEEIKADIERATSKLNYQTDLRLGKLILPAE